MAIILAGFVGFILGGVFVFAILYYGSGDVDVTNRVKKRPIQVFPSQP
jgi:hypothetical protein